MWKSIKIGGQVCVYDFNMASVDQPVDMPYGIQRAAATPIGVLFRLETGIKDGVEHQNCRHYRDAIPNSGHS